MSKPRVVIRAFTCRRDVAMATLIAKLLELEGCEVMVTSSRDFVRTLKLWKPEVVVINTRGYAVKVKEITTEAKIVLIDGEGMQPPEHSMDGYFKRHMHILELVDLCLVWGKRVYGKIYDHTPELAKKKVRIVGYPALDMIKFMPQHVKDAGGKRSIGVVTRFYNLNDHEGRSSLMLLPNEGNLGHTIQQCNAFVGVINSMRILLEHTDFQLEFHPHPREEAETYEIYKKQWFGEKYAHRVKVDTSVSFSHWAVNNQAIISPTSTSFLEAYLLGIPVINIEAFSQSEGNRKDGPIGKNIVAASLTPKTDAELIDLVRSKLPKVEKNAAVEKQLDENCNYNNDESACLKATKLIAKLAHETAKPKGIRMPEAVVDALDNITFRRVCRRKPGHPNMSYRRGYHELLPCLDEMAQDIAKNG